MSDHIGDANEMIEQAARVIAHGKPQGAGRMSERPMIPQVSGLFDDGYRAYQRLGMWARNPFRGGTTSASEWTRGWGAAFKESNDRPATPEGKQP